VFRVVETDRCVRVGVETELMRSSRCVRVVETNRCDRRRGDPCRRDRRRSDCRGAIVVAAIVADEIVVAAILVRRAAGRFARARERSRASR
jgi:hypothetical protein